MRLRMRDVRFQRLRQSLFDPVRGRQAEQGAIEISARPARLLEVPSRLFPEP
jgi:hypothetical protein